MRTRLLLGPAGSGKTFRCQTEIREELARSPSGPPLVLVAPRQSTYEWERHVLADPRIAGFTRLHILSFERLSHFIFDQLQSTPPEMLDDEGRLMVLRSLLTTRRSNLKLFRASSRLTGFAQELSSVLHDIQRRQLTPDALRALGGNVAGSPGLTAKLEDLAELYSAYLEWLSDHELQDANSRMAAATELLLDKAREPLGLEIGALWVDGFIEWTSQELDLLTALLPYCRAATMTLCLDRVPAKSASWLSSWSLANRMFSDIHDRLLRRPEVELQIEELPRSAKVGRFADNPVLRRLETHWNDANPAAGPKAASEKIAAHLRIALCTDPAQEARLAAREIVRFTRSGGRYREVSLLVRDLESYYPVIQRVFNRYRIPLFVDRRESMSHHPLAELTRNALRTLALGWKHEDWFAALKTGLVARDEKDIDELENEALARGWRGGAWLKPLNLVDSTRPEAEQQRQEELQERLERLRRRLVAPFEKLAIDLGGTKRRCSGPQLSAALRHFWLTLGAGERLEEWAAQADPGNSGPISGAAHATVWEQMNAWLANVELAFPAEPLPLRDWLPILEAGLGNLTVGIIPPSLDQVVFGQIDRSRNPDTRLAIILGMNEGVFPAKPDGGVLLTETDRTELQKRNVTLGLSAREQLARERFFGYQVCTRARERLFLTAAAQDMEGTLLNASPYLARIAALFPELNPEHPDSHPDAEQLEHSSELVIPLLGAAAGGVEIEELSPAWRELAALPALSEMLAGVRRFQPPDMAETIPATLTERLYGAVLRSSVSRLEEFAACPFKFFVHSGLRGEERRVFELDAREQGSFQHDVLAFFHEELRRENKRWRDLTPQQGRERIGKIARGFVASYREGLLNSSEQTRFMARVLTALLEDFIEVLIGWMRGQYLFDPVQVELPFGDRPEYPALEVDLPQGHKLALRGRIDRVDLGAGSDPEAAYCVVVDYKSSRKKLDRVLIASGLQLQLLAYLAVLRRWPTPESVFGRSRLVPAGVFYVNLRGATNRHAHRRAAFDNAEDDRKSAYQHSGRFDHQVLSLLDSRKDATAGDQFKYRLKKDGQPYANSDELLPAAEFAALLSGVEETLRTIGTRIYDGHVEVDPYRRGNETACDRCDYRAICRIDPWTHQYRGLPDPRES